MEDMREVLARVLCEVDHRLEGTPRWDALLLGSLARNGYLVVAECVLDDIEAQGFIVARAASCSASEVRS